MRTNRRRHVVAEHDASSAARQPDCGLALTLTYRKLAHLQLYQVSGGCETSVVLVHHMGWLRLAS
jgi:hypothetical protein